MLTTHTQSLGPRRGWYCKVTDADTGAVIAAVIGSTRRATEADAKRRATASPLPAHLLPRE